MKKLHEKGFLPLLLATTAAGILLTGCSSVKTDYTKKAVVIDASLLGLDLQTGFDPATGTPLPKLQMGEIDATYITIPLDATDNKNAAITVENKTQSMWGGEPYSSRKITIKTSATTLEVEKEVNPQPPPATPTGSPPAEGK